MHWSLLDCDRVAEGVRARRDVVRAAMVALLATVSPVTTIAHADDPEPSAPVTTPSEPAPPAPEPVEDTPSEPQPASEEPKTPPPPPAPEPAKSPRQDVTPEVIVFLKDGTRVSGLLVKDDRDGLVVRVAGIETKFPAERVNRYQVMESIYTRYEEMRAAIGDDPEKIVELAQWLRERERLELALVEVERALAINQHLKAGLDLKLLLEQQIILKMRSRTGTPGGGESDTGEPLKEGDPKAAQPTRRSLQIPVLTAKQINLMKVFEIDLEAKREPRMLIPRSTIERLMRKYAGHPLIPVTQEKRDAYVHKEPKEILELMFQLQAREFYGEVDVLDMPPAIEHFRNEVQRTWLLNSCATNACHGGQEAGRLVLVNRRPNSDPSVFTNLLILDRFRLKDGTPLVNYETPERSPLLHMGLPREDSLYPHPVVPDESGRLDRWKRAFRSSDDTLHKETIQWIELMFKPRPEYPIDYPLPRPPESEVAPPPPAPGPQAPAPASESPKPVPSEPGEKPPEKRGETTPGRRTGTPR